MVATNALDRFGKVRAIHRSAGRKNAISRFRETDRNPASDTSTGSRHQRSPHQIILVIHTLIIHNGVVIESERLRLRRWKESDREPFARLNADPRVMEFFPACLSRKESDQLLDHRIEPHFKTYGFGLYAAQLREDGRFVGFIGLAVPEFAAHFTPCVEIGWRLDAEFWGRGLAAEGARAVVSHAFEDLGIRELVSMTVPANLRSRHVMEKIGMTRDPAGDFDHPNLPVGHPLRRHVLYRLSKEQARR